VTVMYPDFAEAVAEFCRAIDKVDPDVIMEPNYVPTRPYIAYVQLEFEKEPCGRLLNDGVGWYYDSEAGPKQ
jgi:hypothetical protein